MMKLWTLVPILFVVVVCSGGSKDVPLVDQGSPAQVVATKKGAPAKDAVPTTNEQEKFDDSVFKVPPYPGAEIMKFTSMEMSDNSSHSYNRHYKTMDSVDKVAEHYMTEGAKVGKIGDSMINKPGAPMRTVIIDISDKERLQVQVMNLMNDKSTDISVHLVTRK